MTPFLMKKNPSRQALKSIPYLHAVVHFLLVVGVFIIIVSMLHTTRGDSIEVDDDGNAQYTRIQDAVDAAESGDTIFIFDGYYEESIRVYEKLLIFEGQSRENVTIMGEGHGEYTIFIGIDNNTQPAMGVVRLSNLTVLANDSYTVYMSLMDEESPGYYTMIDNCSFQGNTSQDDDDGVEIDTGSSLTKGYLSIENCTFSDFKDGLDINMHDTGIPLFIKDCTIRDNTRYGMRINTRWDNNITFSSLIISNNGKGADGEPAVYVASNQEGSLFIDSCELFGNDIGGLYAESLYEFRMTNSYVHSNNKSGIALDRSLYNTIKENRFEDNGEDGFSYLSGNMDFMTLTILDNNFSANGQGLFIYVSVKEEYDLDMRNNEFFDNQMGANIRPPNLGAMMTTNATLINNSFTKNKQALQIQYMANMVIRGSQFIQNENGLYLEDVSNLTMRECTFLQNGNGTYLSLNDEDENAITFSENDFTTNEYGIHLHYNVRFGSSNILIYNNSFTFNVYGINVDYYFGDELPGVTVEKNRILWNVYGFQIANRASNVGGYILSAKYNFINNSDFYGMEFNGDTRNTVNATNNWWGHETGPYHDTSNPDGEGDNVTNNIHFDPWLTEDENPPESMNLTGRVEDTTGGPLAGVLVQLKNGPITLESYTNESGEYIISDVPVEDTIWTLTAIKAGFEKSIKDIWIMEDIYRMTILQALTTVFVKQGAPDGGIGTQEEPFNRIQDAIDHSRSGVTIRIFDGRYHENVVVNKTLNLVGNGSEVTIIDGGGSGDTIMIYADWVNVSNLGITGSEVDLNGILVTGENVTIFDTDSYSNGVGIYVATTRDITLSNVTCRSNNFGIYLLSATGVRLEESRIQNNKVIGIYFYISDDNDITDSIIGPDNLYGIYLSISSNNRIVRNTVVSNPKGGILITESIDNQIIENSVHGNEASGVYLYLSQNSTIYSNEIYGNKDGIHIRLFSKNNSAHDNTIYGNLDFGVNATANDGFTINATDNWWGHVSGPFHPIENPAGRGDIVSDDVLFDPWKQKREPSTLYVDDDAADGGLGTLIHPFNSIQDAVDNAIKGDAIRVFEGTYYEKIMVNLTLTIIGNGSDSTIIDGGGSGVVVRISADRVNMSNLAVTGSSPFEEGIVVEGRGVTIYGIECHNNSVGVLVYLTKEVLLRKNTFSDNEVGIYFFMTSGNRIENNTIQDTVDYGIFLYLSNSNTITGNTLGPNNGYGLFISTSGLNQVENNVINGNRISGIILSYADYNVFELNQISGNQDIGILGEDSNFNEFDNNTITGNSEGIHLQASSNGNTAHHNTFAGNSDYGINSSSIDGDVINATDNWWGDNTGPYHPILNPLGKGDRVTNNVLFDPWVGKIPPEPEVPDLVAVSIAITPESPMNGTDTIITVVIVNKGPGEIGYVRYNVYLDDDIIEENAVGPMQVGEEMRMVFPWIVNGEIGDHQIRIFVDPENEINESDEQNNKKSAEFTISKSQADFGVDITATVTKLDLSGLNFTRITLWITNIGDVRDSYYLKITGNFPGWNITLETQSGTDVIMLDPSEEASIDLLFIQLPGNGTTKQSINVVITVISTTFEEIQDSVSLEGIFKSDDGGSSFPFPTPGPIIIIFGGTGIIFFISSVGFFEPRKFKFFASFIPLYTRLKPSAIEDSQARGEIMGYLRMNPGAHYNTIKRDLGFGNNQLTYHLEVLERNSRIKSTKDGRLKRFYLRKYKIPELEGVFKRIVEVLTDVPNLHRDQVAKIIQISSKTATKHLTKMVEDGKLIYHMVGNKKLYSVAENALIKDTTPRPTKWETSLISRR